MVVEMVDGGGVEAEDGECLRSGSSGLVVVMLL